MSEEKKYYCFCSSNCKYETMTKEQIMSVIAQAAAGGLTFDTGAAFITKVKEQNRGGYITFWVGTQAQYNAIASKEENRLYIITDEATVADIQNWVVENYLTKTDADATYLEKTAAAATYVTKTDAENAYAPKEGAIIRKYDSSSLNGANTFDIADHNLGEFEYFQVTCVDGETCATVTVERMRIALDTLEGKQTKYYVMPTAQGGKHILTVSTISGSSGVNFLSSAPITRVVGYGFA